jgi:hypothetical protein
VDGIDNWAARQTTDSTHKPKSKISLHQAVTEVKLIDIEQEKLNAAIKQTTRTRLLQNVEQEVPVMQQDAQERGSREKEEEEERKQKEEEERKRKEEEERKQKEEQNDSNLQHLFEKKEKSIPELKQRCSSFPSWTEAQVERCLNFAKDGIEYDPTIFEIDEEDILSGVSGIEYSIQGEQNIAAIIIKIVIPVTLMAASLRHIKRFRKNRVWNPFVLKARSIVYNGKDRHVG